MKIAILGAGAWGSALAVSFSSSGHEVALWARSPPDCEAIARTRSSRSLPEVAIPDAVRVEPDLVRALSGSDLVIVATATSGLHATVAAVGGIIPAPRLLWACKGFEQGTSRLPHEIVAGILPSARTTGVLSGPSFALEVALGKPTAVVLASRDVEFATQTATQINSERLRIYSSTDLVGVELGGALKNVMAIATGISDGLGLGTNARAALITRGLAEMARLGVRLEGNPETFMGLAGLGDLVLTATGDLSRNRSVGIRLAQGLPLERILADLGHVAEGVSTARVVRSLASIHAIEMPITEAVCKVLFDGLSPLRAVQLLLSRDARTE